MRGVLALDLARVSGWAFGRLPRRALTPLEAAALKPPKPQSGFHVICKPGASAGKFLCLAEVWLTDLVERLQPAGIIYEAPIYDRHKTAHFTAAKLMGVAGVICMVAHRASITWLRPCQPSSVKKVFSGSGAPGKDNVMAACLARGWNFEVNDEADALAIWHHAAHIAEEEGDAPAALFQTKPARRAA